MHCGEEGYNRPGSGGVPGFSEGGQCGGGIYAGAGVRDHDAGGASLRADGTSVAAYISAGHGKICLWCGKYEGRDRPVYRRDQEACAIDP